MIASAPFNVLRNCSHNLLTQITVAGAFVIYVTLWVFYKQSAQEIKRIGESRWVECESNQLLNPHQQTMVRLRASGSMPRALR